MTQSSSLKSLCHSQPPMISWPPAPYATVPGAACLQGQVQSCLLSWETLRKWTEHRGGPYQLPGGANESESEHLADPWHLSNAQQMWLNGTVSITYPEDVPKVQERGRVTFWSHTSQNQHRNAWIITLLGILSSRPGAGPSISFVLHW